LWLPCRRTWTKKNDHRAGGGGHDPLMSLPPPRTLHEVRMRCARALGDAGQALTAAAGGRATGDQHTLLLVIGERTSRSYSSSCALALAGQGIQAAMLNRSMLEDALDVAWVAGNPDTATKLADEHDRAIYLADRHVEAKYKDSAKALSDAEADELADAARRYRGFRASWTLTGEDERLGLLKASMPAEAAWMVDYTYEAIKKRANVLMHGAPTGWRQITDRGPSGEVRIRSGQSDHYWLQALNHAILGFHLTMRSIASALGVPLNNEFDVFFRATCVVKDLASGQLAQVGDDDPCPCGSEYAKALCHGLSAGG
jgi:hypothetical protein